MSTTELAAFDVIAYLTGKGYQGKKAAGNEVKFPCFFDCNEPTQSRKRKLYVNTVEGYYHCKVCEARGGTTLLLRHFGDEPAADLPGANPAARRHLLEQAAEIGSAMLVNNDDILLYLLNERGLSAETVVERRFGYVPRRWSLVDSLDGRKEDLLQTGLVFRDGPRAGQDFFNDCILIPYQSRGTVVQMRGKTMGGNSRYLTGPGEHVRLYNTDSLSDAEDIIIVEGEFDAAALQQHLELSPEDRVRRIGVAGLAGAGSLPTDFDSWFTEARRVFVGLDPDETGKRYSVKIKEQLGTRARIIELPEELPKCDWSEYLLPIPASVDDAWRAQHPHAGHTWRDVMDLIGNASGKRLWSMREAGQKWRNRQDMGTGIKTGYRRLDSTILPGVLPGQVVVILAKTGTGKTILLCNLAYNTRDVPTLFISLEMTQEEVYERLRRIYLFHNPRASDIEVEDAFANLMICDENRLGAKDFATLVEEFEVETGKKPEQVYVDYLGYYARGQFGNSPYEKTSNAVMQLKAEAKAHRVSVWAPHQVNRLGKEGKPLDADNARDSGVVEETADFMLSIWRPDDGRIADEQEPTGKLKLTINKSRHGGKDRTFTLQMDVLTLAIVDDEDPQAKVARHHTYLAWRGTTYDDLRREQTQPVQQTAWTA